MRKLTVLLAALALLAPVALAEMPAEKLREMQREGITELPTKAAGPVFTHLRQAKAAPAGPLSQKPATKDVGGPETNVVTATVQYDNGVFNALPTVFDITVGNRFNLGLGGLQIVGTLTLNSFSFYFLEDSLADTGMFFNPADPLNATSISSRADVNVAGLANSGLSFSSPMINVIPQTALGTTGVFSNTLYLGGWCLNANTTFPVDNETLGLNDTATFAGGFQGYTSQDGVGAFPFSAQSFNAILRANLTGKNVPVELMSFGVE